MLGQFRQIFGDELADYGAADSYPGAWSATVVDKLRFIDCVIRSARRR
jgi:hypothetical protein